MQEYNKLHGNVVHYYGSDIGGFYSDWKAPMDRIISYLVRVDAAFANILSDQFSPYSEVMSKNARVNYSERLTSMERARLERIFDEAWEAFDSNKEKYIALWNQGEFAWARQSLESMRLAEQYYRNYLQREKPETSKLAGLDGREVALYRNDLWHSNNESTVEKPGRLLSFIM